MRFRDKARRDGPSSTAPAACRSCRHGPSGLEALCRRDDVDRRRVLPVPARRLDSRCLVGRGRLVGCRRRPRRHPAAPSTGRSGLVPVRSRRLSQFERHRRRGVPESQRAIARPAFGCRRVLSQSLSSRGRRSDPAGRAAQGSARMGQPRRRHDDLHRVGPARLGLHHQAVSRQPAALPVRAGGRRRVPDRRHRRARDDRPVADRIRRARHLLPGARRDGDHVSRRRHGVGDDQPARSRARAARECVAVDVLPRRVQHVRGRGAASVRAHRRRGRRRSAIAPKPGDARRAHSRLADRTVPAAIRGDPPSGRGRDRHRRRIDEPVHARHHPDGSAVR